MKNLIAIIALVFLLISPIKAVNTGKVPDGCVKIDFNENGTVSAVEPSDWEVLETNNSIVLSKGSMTITITEKQFKDGSELIGFTWGLENATIVTFTVKHGTTVLEYGNTFITSDRKGVSNAVWCLVETVDPEDPVDPEEPDEEEPEEPTDPEEPDEEDPVEPEEPEEPIEEEPIEEEPEQPEEPVDEPDEVLDDDDDFDGDEPLPDTGDMTGLGVAGILMGFLLLSVSKKKEEQ